MISSRKLCSVIRDDDRTSLEAKALVLSLPEPRRTQAALVFRLMNRVSTLDALMRSQVQTHKEILALLKSLDIVFNTSAYRVQLKGGLWNLATLSVLIEDLWAEGVPEVQAARKWKARSAEQTVRWLREFGMGPFLAYQIMQDLQWIWGAYSDESDWAFLGPGAHRALDRLQGSYGPLEYDKKGRARCTKTRNVPMKISLPPKAKAIMAPLLEEARQVDARFNMFQVEHNLCEWDKYTRIATGEATGVPFKPHGPLPKYV